MIGEPMKKRIITSIIATSLVFSSLQVQTFSLLAQTNVVLAEGKLEKQLTEPVMSLGSALSETQKSETKKLLGDSTVSGKQLVTVDGKIIAKYLSDADISAKVFSSAYIKPLTKGSGVKVEIVTPSKITKVSATTYQNAAITSGVSDVLIRIASVNEVTGEGALAGVYALLEQVGVTIDKGTVQTSQDEIALIDELKSEAGLSDTDANKFLAELKKKVTTKVSKKEKIDDVWLQEILAKSCENYTINFSEDLKAKIISWLKAFAATDTAKAKQTVKQLDQSLLTTDWGDVLSKLDKVLSREELLALDRQDYSNEKVYPAIINAIYKQLLSDIKDKKLSQVKLIYSHSFAIEHLLGSPSSKEKEALNYLRTLCYYYIASVEDSKLADALKSSDKPSWLISDTTKANFLASLKRYQNIGQNPSLQELLNRIAIATGYSYEAFFYKDIKQEGSIFTLTIVCPYLNNERLIQVTYNLKTGECTLTEGKKTNKAKVYNFKRIYKVSLDNHYQTLIKNLKNYRLTKKDIKIFDGTNINEDAHQAYKEVLKQFYDFSQSSDTTTDNFPYLPKLDFSEYTSKNRQFTYAYYDLNHDNIDELIIRDSKDNFPAVYTYNNQVVQLKGVSGYRESMFVFKDGTIMTGESGGASFLGATIYRINQNGSGLTKFLEVSKESLSSTSAIYTIGEYGSSNEVYNSQEEFLKYYPDYEKYLSVGVYFVVNSSKKADLVSSSLFKSVNEFNEKKVSQSTKERPSASTESLNIVAMSNGDYSSAYGNWINSKGDMITVTKKFFTEVHVGWFEFNGEFITKSAPSVTFSPVGIMSMGDKNRDRLIYGAGPRSPESSVVYYRQEDSDTSKQNTSDQAKAPKKEAKLDKKESKKIKSSVVAPSSNISEGDYSAIEELISKGFAYNSEIFDRNEKFQGLIPSVITEPSIHFSNDSSKVDQYVSLQELTDAYNSYKSGTYNSDDILKIWLKRYDIEEVDGAYADQSTGVFSQTDFGAKYFKKDQMFVLNHGGFDFSVAVHFPHDQWRIKKDYIDVPIATKGVGEVPKEPNLIVRVALNKKKYKGGSGQKTKYYIKDVRTIIGTDINGDPITWSNQQAKRLHKAVLEEGKKSDLTFVHSTAVLSNYVDGGYKIALYTDQSDIEPDIVSMYYFGFETNLDYQWISGYEDGDSSHTIPTRYAFTLHEGKPVVLLNQQSDTGYQIFGTENSVPTYVLMSGSDLQKEFEKIFSE